MHPHFIIGGLLHGTAIAVLAFFVLFAASKAEGLIKLLGMVLGIWVLVLALLAVAVSFTGPLFGFPPVDRMHPGWMHEWQQSSQPVPAPSPPKK